MSATYFFPSVQRWARFLAVPLALLAGAANAATASGIDGLTIAAAIPRIDQSSNRLPTNQTLLQSLQAMLQLTNNDWALSNQNALGVVRITNKSGGTPRIEHPQDFGYELDLLLCSRKQSPFPARMNTVPKRTYAHAIASQ